MPDMAPNRADAIRPAAEVHRLDRTIRLRRRKNRTVFLATLDPSAAKWHLRMRRGKARRVLTDEQLVDADEFEPIVLCACGRHHPVHGFKGCPRLRTAKGRTDA